MGLVTPCATIRPFPVHFFLPFSDLCSELVASEPRREFRAPAYTFLSPFFIPESDVTLLNLPIPPRIYIYTHSKFILQRFPLPQNVNSNVPSIRTSYDSNYKVIDIGKRGKMDFKSLERRVKRYMYNYEDREGPRVKIISC